jgi:hypothetical protein
LLRSEGGRVPVKTDDGAAEHTPGDERDETLCVEAFAGSRASMHAE